MISIQVGRYEEKYPSGDDDDDDVSWKGMSAGLLESGTFLCRTLQCLFSEKTQFINFDVLVSSSKRKVDSQ